jgi:hypothetical protein
VGSRWGRNPPIGQSDFRELCQSVLLCQGAVAESPLYEYALDILSRSVLEPRYRLTSAYDFPFRRWLDIYNAAKPPLSNLQVQVFARPKYDIRELMFNSSHRVKIKDIPRTKLLDSLCVLDDNFEISGVLSVNELELLKQVRREMVAYSAYEQDKDLDWTECDVAAAVLYNLAVSSNENHKLSLSRRGYSTIAKNTAVVDAVLSSSKKKSSSAAPLFTFIKPRLNDTEHTAHEHAIQWDIFKVINATRDIRHRRRVFSKLYTLAASMSSHLCGKSFSVLFTRWDTMNTASRRQAAKSAKSHASSRTTEQLTVIPATAAIAVDQDIATESTPVAACLIEESQGIAANPLDIASQISPSYASGAISSANGTHCDSSGQSNSLLPDTPGYHMDEIPVSQPASQQYLLSSIRSAAPGLIDEAHLDMLLSEATQLKRHPGKWLHIFKIFQNLYPASTVSVNALQCRLRRRRADIQRLAIAPPVDYSFSENTSAAHQPTVVTKKRRATSCESCQQRRKKCGRDSGNPQCTNRDVRSSSIASFFS